MKPTPWAAILLVATALSVGLPAATAAYDAGSQVEADAPVYLSGRTDALIPNSVASFVGSGSADYVFLSLRASQLALESWTVPPPCAAPSPAPATLPTGPTCAPPSAPETFTLHDAQVLLLKPVTAYKLVVTNDAQYGKTSSFGAPGSIIVTSGASTTLGATPEALHMSPYAEGWDSDASNVRGEPVYQAEALDATATARGGAMRATGGMQILLQGLQVRVTGLDERGNAVDETYNTPYPADEADDTKFLVLETTQGDLNAATTSDVAAFGVKTIDVRQSATLRNAEGKVVRDGATDELSGTDITLQGPLELTITDTKQGSGSTPRIAFAISSTLRVAELAQEPPADNQPLELAAAGAAGAGGAALLAALVYFWPRLKVWTTLLFLPMYTRIERTAVLDHEKRDEIYELIRATPGIHAHEIGEKTRIGWGTTVYHLKMLEQHSLVVSKKSGRYKRFFVNTGEYTKKKDLYGALRNETAKAVADYIVNHPGTNQKELCLALGIQPSLASWHVEKLEGVELVKRVKDGRTVRYYAGAGWEQLNVPVPPTNDDGSTAAS